MEGRKNLLFFHIWGNALKQVRNTIEQLKIRYYSETVLKACLSRLNCGGNAILQEHRTPENEKWVWANSKNIQLDNRVLCFFSGSLLGCTNRCSLAVRLRGNRERMRKWRGNGERMRKWGGNGEKMRKWRYIDSLHFPILSLFPPSFSISSLSFHFLHQNASHFVAKC